MQNLLLARSQQPTPGFKVDSVYYPASEVGGDFFLVSPGTDGSLLAIVGDLAGKGMLAAMRVSVILGILRREDDITVLSLVCVTLDGGDKLRQLNRCWRHHHHNLHLTQCCEIK